MIGPALTACTEPLPALDDLGGRWLALQADASPNFFTCWTWMGSWLASTGAQPELFSIRDGAGGDIALALIGRSQDQRRLGQVATLRLNEAGTAAADRAFIEYNGLLCRTGYADDAHRLFAQSIARRTDWRAMRLSGVAPTSPLPDAIPARRRRLIDESPAYFVDLTRVRAADRDYLSLLSSNTRNQIRRSAKDYPAGDILVERAGDEATVHDWLEQMRGLNSGRHRDNAWEEPLFRASASAVTLAGLRDDNVDLLRVSAGDQRLGFLLNFRSGDRAMNYQSAFADPLSPKSKPGLMTHAAAVRHYADAGLALYSLLAGKDRYKQSLATGHETLQWWMLERFSPALEAEYWLRRLLRK